MEGISTGPYLKEVLLNLHKFEFEKRKELVELFTGFLKLPMAGADNPLVQYLCAFKTEYMNYIFSKYVSLDVSQKHTKNYNNSYEVKGMTFYAGMLLRALLEKEELHKILLNLEYINKLVVLITDATFDVASDAIDSFTVRFFVCFLTIDETSNEKQTGNIDA